MYVLDTDHISVIQHEEQPAYDRLMARLDKVPEGTVYMAIVSFHEQVMGWNAKIAHGRVMADVILGYSWFERLLKHYAESNLLSFDDPAGAYFARLRKAGIRIGTNDLRIASVVLLHDMILLTRNTKDFSKVPGLKHDDWTVRP